MLIYCFWHLGKPFSSHSSPLQTWGFRRRETALPWSQRSVALLKRMLPQGTFSLGWTDPESLDHITPHGGRGSLSPYPLFLHWALCSPSLICENESPLPRPVLIQFLALARTAVEEGWAQRFQAEKALRWAGGKGLQAGVWLHPLHCPRASFVSRSAA